MTLEPADVYKRFETVDEDEAWNSLVLRKKGPHHQTLHEQEEPYGQFDENELQEDDNDKEKVEIGRGPIRFLCWCDRGCADVLPLI